MANEYFGIKPINFDDISIHGGVTGDTYLHSGGSLTSNLNTKFTISDLFDYWETTSAIWQIGVSGVELVSAGNVFLDGNLDVTSLGTSDFLFSSGNTITGGSFSSVNLSSFNNDLVDNNDIDYISTVSYDGINGEIDFVGVGNAFSGAINLGTIPLSDFNNDLIDNNDIDYISNVAYNGVGGSLDFTGVGNAFNANIDLSLIPLSDFNNDIAAGGTQNLTWTSGTSTLSISDGNSQVINTFGSLSISGFGTTDFLYSNLDTITAGTWASVNLSSFNNDLVDANDIDYVSGISFNNATGNFDVTGVGNGFSGSIDLSTFNLSHFNNDLTDLNDIDYISNVAYDGINGEIDFTGVGNGFTGSILLSSIPLSDFNNDLTDINDIDYVSTVAFNNTTGTINFTGVGNAFTGNLDASVFNLSHFNNDLVDANDIDYISSVAYNGVGGTLDFTGIGNAFNSNIDLSLIPLSDFNNDLVDNNDIDYISLVNFNNTTGNVEFTGVGSAYNSNIDLSTFNLSHFNNDLVDNNDIDYISNLVFNNTTGNLEVTGIGSAFNSNIDLSTFNLSHFNNDLADANDIDYISNVSYNGVGGSIDFTGVGNGYNGALLLSGIPLSDFNNDLASELQSLTWTSGTNTLAISGGNSQLIDTFNSLNITSIANADFLYTNTNAVTGGTWAGVNLSSFNDDVSLWESTGTYSISPKDAPLNNIFLGTNVGNSITTGDGNISMGFASGINITSGVDNILLGEFAGNDIADGSYNVVIGDRAADNVVSASDNVIIGREAGQNLSGGSNFALGYRSLRGFSGANNVAIGGYAMGYNTGTTGFNNVAIGPNTGARITTGNRNVLIGQSTGENLSTGYLNTSIGTLAGGLSTTGYLNVFIGYQAGYNELGNNKLYISNSGTTTPLIYGEFNNSLARVNGSFEVTDKTGTAINVASWDGDKIIDSGTSIASLANTDSQTLSFTSPNLSISGGNSVDLSALGSDFDAMDSYSFGASAWAYRAEDAGGNVLGEPLIITAGTGLTMAQTTNGFTLNSTATSSPWTDFGTYLSSNGHDITAEDVNLTYRATDAISLNGRDASGWVTDIPLGTGLSLSSGTLSNTLPGLWSDFGTYVKLGSATDDVFIQSALLDDGQSPGASGQILSSTGTATDWIDFEKPFTLFTASNTSFPSSGEINLTESIASSYSASGTNITVPSNGYYEIIVNFDYTTGGSEGDQFDVSLRDGVTQLEKTEVPVGPAFLNGGNGSILAVEYLTTSSSVSVYVFNVTGKSVEVERLRVSFKKLD